MSYVGASTASLAFRAVDQILDELLRKQRAKDRPRPQHKHVWAEMTRPGRWCAGRDAVARPYTCLPAWLWSVRLATRRKVLICLMDGEGNSWDLQEEWLLRAVPDLGLVPRERAALDGSHCFHAETSRGRAICRVLLLRMLLEGKVDQVIRSLPATARHAPSDGRETQTAPGHHYVLRQQPTAYAVR